jgi:hypothetical protein
MRFLRLVRRLTPQKTPNNALHRNSRYGFPLSPFWIFHCFLSAPPLPPPAVGELDSLGIMRIALVISALLLCGCGASHQQTQSPVVIPPTILDEALARPEYADAIKQAERTLPDDQWNNSPMHMNLSRERREMSVATNILATIEPKFSQMSVTELVHTLKVEPRLSGEDFGGVAGYVYEIGNIEIIKQIQSRPKDELRVLPSLADDKVEVYEGSQGPGATLDELIHYRILKDR